MVLQDTTIAFVGSGVMAEAMMRGLLHEHLIAPNALIAADPHEGRGQELTERYELRFTTDNETAARDADVLVLSVKPQVIKKVLPQVKASLKPETLVISIAAGVQLATISAGTGAQYVVRAMPNTPGQIGAGMTVWTSTADVSNTQRTRAEAVLGALGETLFVQDENYMDMATALNGSGPSYVFLLMEAMIDAGVHMGFSRQDAQTLVHQTMLGAVQYAIQSGEHPAQLRNQVTSPGGTSASALYELERGRLRTVITDAIWAAYRRSVELGSGKNGEK